MGMNSFSLFNTGFLWCRYLALRAADQLFCVTCDPWSVVIAVIDVTRSKEKGYETTLEVGFCDEVGHSITDFDKVSRIFTFIGYLQDYDCCTVNIYDQSTSSGNDAKMNLAKAFLVEIHSLEIDPPKVRDDVKVALIN
ncbi:hypothetical protein LguiB_034855 [Lonicera macranthoides]